MPSSAVGIPDRTRYRNPLQVLRPGELADFIIQLHKARRAGKHYDIRIGSPEIGLLSWASKKPIPTEEEQSIKRLLIEQPTHAYNYKDFEGEIESGYGAGTVEKLVDTKILITDIGKNYIKFTTAEERNPQRFILIQTTARPRKWLLMNVTPLDYPEGYEKPRFKVIDPEEVEEYIAKMRDGDTLQEKIDGAHGLIRLLKNGIEVLSVRKSVTGRPIVHTERIFKGKTKFETPPELVDTFLTGEIYGEKEGKIIPPQDLGAILNSVIAKAIEKQDKDKISLRIALFDLLRMGARDLTDLPYKERYEKIRTEILPKLPQSVFEMVQQAETPEEAEELWNAIRSGKYPRTQEGVILRLQDEERPIKAKLFKEMDVYIRDIFPGEGKYKGRAAGGFTYSLEPDGKIVGRVGTGFSDSLRQYMWEHPEEFIGRVARVKYQEQFPSGSLRSPSFIALHEGQ